MITDNIKPLRIAFQAIGALGLIGALGVSCSQDDGNYDYLPDEQVSEIKLEVDTTFTKSVYQYSTVSPGDEFDIHIKVDYAYADRLQYRWFVLKTYYNSYRAEQVGNEMVYPPADTIFYEKDLKLENPLKPGTYQLYLQARDPQTGMVQYLNPIRSYIVVKSAGTKGGLYLLTEREGQTDIEVFTSDLMLIYDGLECTYKYYSGIHGKYLEGKPRFIKGTHSGKTSKDAYLVATDKNLYRLNSDGLITMQTWDDMFYTTPEVFNPEASFFANNCDVLINNGKMHVLYANQPNDMKFSEPVAGDYDAFPFLMRQTYTTWRPVAGAIDAWQIIYDRKHHSFRPYFPRATKISNFKATVEDAYVDANNVPGDVKAVFQGGAGATCVVTVIDGTPYLYRYQFYNVVDNGDLSADGVRSVLDLSGCTDILNARQFCANTSGMAFYYSTPRGVFSFSPSSGRTTSNIVYTCAPGEEITSIYIYGSTGGGWPTYNCILWVGIWNEGTQEGKLFQSEMDVDNGVPNSMWGPMFGAPDNPVISTGWGKIVDMTCLDAE